MILNLPLHLIKHFIAPSHSGYNMILLISSSQWVCQGHWVLQVCYLTAVWRAQTCTCPRRPSGLLPRSAVNLDARKASHPAPGLRKIAPLLRCPTQTSLEMDRNLWKSRRREGPSLGVRYSNDLLGWNNCFYCLTIRVFILNANY